MQVTGTETAAVNVPCSAHDVNSYLASAPHVDKVSTTGTVNPRVTWSTVRDTRVIRIAAHAPHVWRDDGDQTVVTHARPTVLAVTKHQGNVARAALGRTGVAAISLVRPDVRQAAT